MSRRWASTAAMFLLLIVLLSQSLDLSHNLVGYERGEAARPEASERGKVEEPTQKIQGGYLLKPVAATEDGKDESKKREELLDFFRRLRDKPLRPLDYSKITLIYTEASALPPIIELNSTIYFFTLSGGSLTIEPLGWEPDGSLKLNITLTTYGLAFDLAKHGWRFPKNHSELEYLKYSKSIVVEYFIENRTGFYGGVELGILPLYPVKEGESIMVSSLWEYDFKAGRLRKMGSSYLLTGENLVFKATIDLVNMRSITHDYRKNRTTVWDWDEIPLEVLERFKEGISKEKFYVKLAELTKRIETVFYCDEKTGLMAMFEANTGIPLVIFLPARMRTIRDGEAWIFEGWEGALDISPLAYLLGLRNWLWFWLEDIEFQE